MDFILPLEGLESGRVDDRTVRGLIRYGCARELALRDRGGEVARAARMREFLRSLHESPIAVHADAANRQHYEAPAEFFQTVLGKHCKYSCCYWPDGVDTLDEAEEEMLRLVCARAGIADGQDVLDLGCGWGALSLYLAEHYPQSRITGVSGSHCQKAALDRIARERRLANLRIVTADVSVFDPGQAFDRIVSVEMFEHLRNYEELFSRLARWLRPAGRLFVHVFSHARHAYFYEDSWMAEHFFTGGLMPSDDLLLHFANGFSVEGHWRLDGMHYQKTSEAWLANQDRRRDEVLEIFRAHYGADARKMFQMWRLFFLICAESFGFDQGRQWGVSHYVFARR
jgi:cyclopropane-fatty-acyl-phospholipid synthase